MRVLEKETAAISNQLPERILALKNELFAVETQTCYERAIAITRSYKASEGEPAAIRRGKGLRDIFTHMPLYIRPGELIAGSRSSRLGWESSYPEYDLDLHENWPSEVKEYWQGKTIHDLCRRLFTPVITDNMAENAAGPVTGTKSGFGHVIIDYEKAITKGFRAISDEAIKGLESAGDDEEGRDFLNACVIACEAIIDWANRYADLAEKEAMKHDGPRREELLEIARVCRRVPEYPAASYREALQSFWFVHIAMHIEQRGWSISVGHFDRYIYPFYKADIENGIITKEAAFELLLNLWVKFMENVDVKLKLKTFQNMTLGGQDANGKDLSNEFTHLCLDATMRTGFTQPALSARWHENVDRDFWDHVMRTIATGVGMPALFNDTVIIDELVEAGVAREDAVNYGLVGCIEPAIPGKEQGKTSGGNVNIAKALELALSDGRSLITGTQLGPHTGNAENFKTFDELFKAYARQSRHLMGVTLTVSGIVGNVQKQYGHCPLMSCLLDDCLEKRRDLAAGGTQYSLSAIAVVGTTNVCDGLMALKKIVFEEGRYTMAEICAALKADFKGYEIMRQVLKNNKYRFGNDIPEVDEMANKVNAVHAEFAAALPDPRGGHYVCGIWPVDSHVLFGYKTGALPEGRGRGMPLSDGVGACQGADVSGPTALLNSVARLNNKEHWQGGNTCNIKFSRSSIQSENGFNCMSDLIEVFMRQGGQEVQINVVDAATLRRAQENPKEYADLVVRVAGYSAYFVTLSRDIQNEIISRTVQAV